ncbi:hypothetical protein PUN28_020597 [Cardiocondyla obscurior]|uniref:Uncharacterized protein n=1 Tax=Cardiocondyla obscurior TaxID=286306 RepID=A0AAW2E8Q0_9HYME
MNSGLFEPLFSSKAEIWPKTKKIFLNFGNIALSRDMAKNEKNILKFYNIWPKTKKIFLKFYNVALCGKKKMHTGLFEPLFSSEAEIWPKTKKIFEILQHMAKKQNKIFLKFNNIALCGIQNRCIQAYSEFFIFIRSRDMAKNEKNILKFYNHCAAIKSDAYKPIPIYSEPSIFTSSRDMAKKQKKIFLKFNKIALCKPRYGQKRKKYFEILQRSIVRQLKNCIRAYSESSIVISTLCGIQNRCIQAYSEFFIFIRSRDMAKKQKKIFLKFYNVALCGIQNRCIWAYSSFYFHQKPRYGQKQKNIFEILQRSIVRQLKKCIRVYSEFLFSPAAEIWPKNKKIF